MKYFKLIYLSVFFGIVSILAFFNITYSYYLNLYLNLNTYIFTFIVSILLTILFYYSKNNDEKKITIYDKILTILLGYFLLPLVISIPFYFSIYNLTFVNAFFESISGFTSTGFTIFDNINHIDQSLILWRSASQWIGGLYFLFSIILLIDIFDHSFKKSLTNFLSFNKSETFKQAFKIFLFYSLITLSIFIILSLFDIRLFNSLNLAMTIISSGGFLPSNNLSNLLVNNSQVIIISILLLSSFFSIFLIYNLIFTKNHNLNFFNEDIHLLFYFLFLLIIFFVFLNFENNFSELFLSLTSSISNVGFSLNNSSSNLSFVFLILVIIGGSFFSTSSGIRFLKIYSLFKYSINEILSYSRPKNIYINKHLFSKDTFKLDEIYKYFLSVIVFIISLLILTFLLTLSGIDFESSFKLSILTIMNTVNSSMFALADFSFYDLHFITKYYLIFFMIIGRLELLTLLIICKKFLFKN
ncbi:TrkH family potassium uptake protein [Candidatus Pelagibacter ubique]|jgi:trk system potassium uptake protein TrkH|nr:TrkH family potassium uptake protein [Candidatus Pelagibacter ubique]MDA7472795.1 TrkH family potassium uptake protein [Candidatus Pelagibacter ubique]MDC0391008.1 TrkH family potassium uptake protein [Candidatus Pelagibacter ubique]MDC0616971.1 TrkH family potassium uptake protein [Candidatus Pelagibacter ubique]MDC0951559.1 TrkH family potassium uptake protein [Candidatus Pelagibacter ubique]